MCKKTLRKPKKNKKTKSPGTLDQRETRVGQESLEICFFGFLVFSMFFAHFQKTLVFSRFFGGFLTNFGFLNVFWWFFSETLVFSMFFGGYSNNNDKCQIYHGASWWSVVVCKGKAVHFPLHTATDPQ